MAVEAAVIAVLGTQIISFETAWSMDWIFELAFVVTIIFYAIRTASLMADDPKQSALRLTILWSPISMQFCVIGVIAGLAVDITQDHPLLKVQAEKKFRHQIKT
ncbi:hypothetical protein RBH20_19610 [Haloarcula sp. H-GB4]|uniref:hypothetical protein n=1 Tax=Haloarcula sp. H-GB4 TaxID=3069755 RepID=UPI0027B24A34|nr:hypothetical protein [Haloarcula sp. H-GB4]MDQ2074737.1 hypothetical protein [Haloarcula sp. H-GB4]